MIAANRVTPTAISAQGKFRSTLISGTLIFANTATIFVVMPAWS